MRWRWGACIALTALVAAQVGCWTMGIEGPGAKAPATKYALRVIAGTSQAYTDKAGNVWQAEKMYTEGGGFGFVGDEANNVHRGDIAIEGTNDPEIYRTERWLMEKFVAELPNGKYTVALHFAETYPDIATDGPRVFNVTIQGKTVLKDFDVSKTAGGVQKAVVKTFPGVEVTDGKLVIGFEANQQNPEINGIEILGE